MKIVILNCGGIGDGVLAFPLITALRDYYPAASVEWCGRSDVGTVALAAGHVGTSRTFPTKFWEGGKRTALSATTITYLNGFDLVVSTVYDPDGLLKSELITKVTARSVSCQVDFSKPSIISQSHAALATLGINGDAPGFGIQSLRKANDGTLAVLPGTSMAKKYWPESRWLAFAKACPWPMTVFVDRTDLKLGQSIVAQVASGRATLLQVALADVAKRLGACSSFLGLESGLSHLAYALGVTGTMLWATTGTDAWKPQVPHVTLLTTRATETQVIESLKPLWPIS